MNSWKAYLEMYVKEVETFKQGFRQLDSFSPERAPPQTKILPYVVQIWTTVVTLRTLVRWAYWTNTLTKDQYEYYMAEVGNMFDQVKDKAKTWGFQDAFIEKI